MVGEWQVGSRWIVAGSELLVCTPWLQLVNNVAPGALGKKQSVDMHYRRVCSGELYVVMTTASSSRWSGDQVHV